MIRILRNTALAALLFGVSACGDAGAGLDVEAYEAELQEWRAGRLERLVAPTGFLTQVGLFWLEDGRYTVGAGPDNAVRLPATAAHYVGEIVVSDGAVQMSIADGVEVTHEGTPVSDIELPADTSGEFKDLLKQLLRCERPQGEIVDRKLAESDARRLYKVAATPRFIIFIMICLVLLLALKIHNFNQLQLMHIFACYILLSTLCYHTLVHKVFGS